jgi:hypothetical protein
VLNFSPPPIFFIINVNHKKWKVESFAPSLRFVGDDKNGEMLSGGGRRTENVLDELNKLQVAFEEISAK